MLHPAARVSQPQDSSGGGDGGRQPPPRQPFSSSTSSSTEFLDSPYSIFQDVVRSNEVMAESSVSSASKENLASDLGGISDAGGILSPSSSTLLTASDETLEASIARFGAVKFVRQLATDIADRDTKIWKLRRSSEDKVRVLSAMLRARSSSSVGVQADIDYRMRDIDLAIDREFTALNGTSVAPSTVANASKDKQTDKSGHDGDEARRSRLLWKTVPQPASDISEFKTANEIPPSSPSLPNQDSKEPSMQEETTVPAQQDVLLQVPPPSAVSLKKSDGSRLIEKEARKSKAAFRIPFFWKSEENVTDDERDSNLRISATLSHDPSISASSTSTLKPGDKEMTSSSMSTHSDSSLARIRKAFAVPLFPEESSLPPLITTETNGTTVDGNTNTIKDDGTAITVKHNSRRKQHVIAPEREIAIRTGLESDGTDDDDLVLVNEKGEEEGRSSSSDELAGSGGSFKSAAQSPSYDDDSPRNEISSPLFSAAFRRSKATAKNSFTSGPSGPKQSASQAKMANGIRERVNLRSTTYEYDYDDEKSAQSQPRKSRFDSSVFPIPFRSSSSKQARPRSRSRGSVQSRISQNNLPEWLPQASQTAQLDESDQLMVSSLVGPSSNSGNNGNLVASGNGDRGPVELENIVPQNIQPPTLLQSWGEHYRSEDTFLLTDRFGFIYDRQHRPVLPPTEAHSSSAGYRFLENIDGGFEFFFDRDDHSLGSNIGAIDRPEPAHLSDEKDATSEVFGQTAVGARPGDDSLESVRVLLSQLTDLHDSLQRVQKTRWDEFLRKINDSAAESSSPISMETGELFGFHGRVLLSNKVLNGRTRYKEFKALVLGGIPVVYRSKLWSECGGADSVKVPGVYEELVNLEFHRSKIGIETEDEAVAQIDLDLYRTMPSNVFFGGKGPGVPKLKRVLLAFSRRNPDIGYCQGSMFFLT